MPELAIASGRLLVNGGLPARPGVEAGEIGPQPEAHAEGFAGVIRHRAALDGSLVGAGKVCLDEVAIHAEAACTEDDAALAFHIGFLAALLDLDADDALAVVHQGGAGGVRADIGAGVKGHRFHGVGGVVHAEHDILAPLVHVDIMPDGAEAYHVHVLLAHDPVAGFAGKL